MTEAQEKHKERRKALKELSAIAKARLKMDCEGMTVNEFLIDEIYTDAENTEFHTIHGWNKKGFQVKKGSVSFLVWGKPKKLEKAEQKPENTDEEKDDFYPLCYLFSNAQVQQRDAKK